MFSPANLSPFTVLITNHTCNVFYIHSSWLDSLIWTGYKRELKQEDLYAIPDNCRSQVLLRGFKRCVCVYIIYVCCMCVCVCLYVHVCVHMHACICVI